MTKLFTGARAWLDACAVAGLLLLVAGVIDSIHDILTLIESEKLIAFGIALMVVGATGKTP